MLKNYFKIAWRQILKNKVVSLINIIGLGLGLTLSLFILLFIKNEISYDKWIPDHENIYRVYRPYKGGAKGLLSTPTPLVQALKEEVPGVINATNVRFGGNVLIESNKLHYTIEKVAIIDSTFFHTIPLTFKQGDKNSLSKKLELAIFSAKKAEQIFGDENPVGKTILLENETLLEIAGVLEIPKGQSHIGADLFILEKPDAGTHWTGNSGHTYIRLAASAIPENISESIFKIAKREILKEDAAENEPPSTKFPKWGLQAMSDIHLGSENFGQTAPSNGSPWQIKLMIMIGILVLFLACINYINLSTAQTNLRSKEIGIRNVTGASRKQLISQFLTESLSHIGLSLVTALLFAQFLLPYFNETVSRNLEYSQLFYGKMPFIILGLSILIGLGSGFFPALYWSSIKPAESLKKQFFNSKKTSSYRNVSIIGQFTLTIGLMLFVVLVWKQIDFILKKDLGFQGDQIAIIRINQEETVNSFQVKKSQLEQIAGVESVTQTSRPPGSFIPNYGIEIEKLEKSVYVNMLFSDYSWNEVFQIPVKQGRFFSNEFPSDSTRSFVVNETFVEQYKLDNPIGHRMKFSGDESYSTIIGVVEDFHYQGMEMTIAPLAFCSNPDMAWLGNVAVRLDTKSMSSSIAQISEVWKSMEPVFPVSYNFIDENFAKQYQSYLLFGRQLSYATILCLIIALSGLFGLTLFIIQRRTKEIGIRKVLGASTFGIIKLVSKDFIKLVLVALIIATPIAIYLINKWLSNFAYQIEIHWWFFVLAGIAIMGLVFFIVGIQSLKTAMINPVDSIRNE